MCVLLFHSHLLELYKLHACFVTLRLHILFVVGETYRGIITRNMIMKIAEISG